EPTVSRLSRLSRLQRVTLILFVLVAANWVMESATGYSLLGGDLFTVFFVFFFALLCLTLLRPVMQKVLWRVRNRLFVMYLLTGVLPIALIFLIVLLGFYILVGQTTQYLFHAELDRRIDQLYASAERLAQEASYGTGRASPTVPGEQALVRVGQQQTLVP